jgi:uncharacterized protein YbaR (Trm112 family)
MPIDADFLGMLACPACRKELALLGDERLYCAACRRSFPVRDDIPILLLDEARIETLNEDGLPAASTAAAAPA